MAAKQKTPPQSTPIEEASPHTKPLVFISHDTRDADLAEAFSILLADVSAGTLKSFRSSDKKGTSGIEFGAEWYNAIMLQLDHATDVVALLTHRSIERPWILYEAGVAKGKLNTTVLGLALGVPLGDVSAGAAPFGQFQNCGDDEDSLTKLVMQLLQRNPDAAPREEAVRTQVKAFIVKKDTILSKIKNPPKAKSAVEDANTARLFEEIKIMLRDLERSTSINSITSRARKEPRRFFLEFFDQFNTTITKVQPATRAPLILLMASILRDENPIFYELLMNCYRALTRGVPEEIFQAHETFVQTTHLLAFGPFDKYFFSIGGNNALNPPELLSIVDKIMTATDAPSKTRQRTFINNTKIL